LTLTKSLVEMHGGSIQVQSDGPQLGSQFTVRLPALAAASAAQAPSLASAVPIATVGKLRVLVVDDNLDAVQTLGRLVRLLGHVAHLAYDGEQAIAAASEWQPQVILMDIGMPKLNGYEAAQRIRATSWGQHMVLIAATGWGQEDDKRRTKEAGFDHHLVKPVDTNLLRELLANCLADDAGIEQPEVAAMKDRHSELAVSGGH